MENHTELVRQRPISYLFWNDISAHIGVIFRNWPLLCRIRLDTKQHPREVQSSAGE